MKLRNVIIAASLLSLTGLTSLATSQPYQPLSHSHHTQTMTQNLNPFPTPKHGMKQFAISLPPQADEHSFRVGVMVGRMMQTDGVNRIGLSGKMEKRTIHGWGYNYYELTGSGPAFSTLMASIPGRPSVSKFVSVQEELLRYNSRLPLVIYVPADMDVRYRIFSADDTLQAQEIKPERQSGSHQHSGMSAQQLELSGSQPATLPPGSSVTIQLYDSMLMDADSTYASHRLPITNLPINLPLPRPVRKNGIVMPAVSVAIHDSHGQLLYVNDIVTPMQESGKTHMKLIRTR